VLEKPRRANLALLAALSLFVIWQGTKPDPGPDPGTAFFAILLGGSTIVMRRVSHLPTVSEKSALVCVRSALLTSLALGLLGAWSSSYDQAGQTGLLFVTAGALFIIRPFRRPGTS